MANPKWFDVDVYLANKLAQLQKAEPTAGWTAQKLADAFAAAGLVGAEGAYKHFEAFGAAENLSPNALFDAEQYFYAKAAQANKISVSAVKEYQVAEVKDAIKKAGMNAWTHYDMYGSFEGVNPSNSFDEAAYLAAKLADLKVKEPANWPATKTVDDVKAAFKAGGVSALEHYLAYGKDEAFVAADKLVVADANKVPTTAASAGQTFTLTTGVDSGTAFAGTANSDTFEAAIGVAGASTTFQATDVVKGGAGTDTFNITVQSGATGGTAVAQVNTYVFGAPVAGTDTIVVNYGSVTSTIITGATAATAGAAFAAAINNAAGQVIAVNAAGTVTVTAPVAGTALPAITFGAATAAADLPAVTFTTPNTPGIDLTTAVAAPTVLVEGMEVVNVRNVGGAFTLDGANFPGVTEFKSDRSTGANTFNNIGTADVTIVGDDVVTNGNVNFSSSATASVTDALVLNLKGGVNAGTVTSTNANDDWTTATVNSTGGTATATTNANVLTALNIAGGSRLQTLTINAESSVTTGAIAGWDTTTAAANKGKIIVTGAAAANIGALNAAVETVDASGNAGGVTLTASTQTDFQFVGSSGNDRVTTNAVLTAAGSVNAGAGTGDRLIVGNNGDITLASGARYSGFEQLQVANSITVDMDHLNGTNSIDTIRLTTGGVVNNMTAAQAANVIVTAGGNSATLTVKDGTTLGQVDTVKITADDALAAVNTIALATPVLTGVEKLELVATDNITIAALTGATSLDSIKISGAGTVGITSGASLGNTNQSIDGSAATGVLTISVSAATAAVKVTGGTAADILTTSANADLVNGKGGLDSITIAGASTVQSEATVAADADLITGFVSGTNFFDYNGALANGTGVAPTITAAEVNTSATTFQAALADVAASSNTVVFIAQGNIAPGAGGNALNTLAGAFTAANIAALENALVGTGGALNGAIANLDTVLGASDAVLLALDNGTNSVVLRVTNTDTSTVNTLTAAEIEVVGVFNGTVSLAAADFV